MSEINTIVTTDHHSNAVCRFRKTENQASHSQNWSIQ